MKLWICGQLNGEWNGEETAWEFQGVFDSEDKADKACIDKSYFYFSCNLNEELPKEAVDAPDGKYPRIDA